MNVRHTFGLWKSINGIIAVVIINISASAHHQWDNVRAMRSEMRRMEMRRLSGVRRDTSTTTQTWRDDAERSHTHIPHTHHIVVCALSLVIKH